jgi:hypothetical protein
MRRVFYILSLVLVCAAPAARAQVLSPALDRHTLEIGYTHKWYGRDFESLYLGESDWSAGAIYLRYGTCRWATLTFEGGISHVDNPDFEEMDYRRYTIGAGLTAIAYRWSQYRIDASAHYSEIFDHDRSEDQYHKNVRDLTFAIQVQRYFTVEEQTVVLWAGPAYVYNQSRQYPWHTTDPVKNDTDNNWGFVIGGDAVLFERVSVFVHGVYADDFKPRVGIGFQF